MLHNTECQSTYLVCRGTKGVYIVSVKQGSEMR